MWVNSLGTRSQKGQLCEVSGLEYAIQKRLEDLLSLSVMCQIQADRIKRSTHWNAHIVCLDRFIINIRTYMVLEQNTAALSKCKKPN